MPESNSEQEFGELIEGHTYDGIQEYDNPMPKWWLYMFYLTIAWGVFYLVGINVGWIDTYEDTLAKENARIDKMVAAAEEASPDITPEYLQGAVAKGEHLEAGKAAFTTYCASCHGQNGEGLVGPNLTDSAWVHGGSLTDIHVVVDKGVLDKGMPAWGAILKSDQMLGVITYIDSIRNTNVPGKAPEGEPYEPDGAGDTPAAPAAEGDAGKAAEADADGAAQPGPDAAGAGVDGETQDGDSAN